MWRWMILIILLGFKLSIPICCVKFNYEGKQDNPAVTKPLPPGDAERINRLAPYLDDNKPHK